jgi:hypothetical protein
MSLFKCCFGSRKHKVKPKDFTAAYDPNYYDSEAVLDPPTIRQSQPKLNETERPTDRNLANEPETGDAGHRSAAYNSSKHWREDPETYKYLTPFNARRRKMM